MLMVILSVFVFVRSVSKKEYWFTAVSAVAILHGIIVALENTLDTEFLDVLQMIEIGLLIALPAMLVWCAWDTKGKRCVVSSVFATTACVVRFIRSAVYDQYMAVATQPDADATAVLREFAQYYDLMNVLISICILVVMVCVALHLRKK